MASSNSAPRPSSLLLTTAALLAGLAACNGAPSKGEALDLVRNTVKEEAKCTLPLGVLSELKRELTTKSFCVLREGASANAAHACMDSLVTLGVTSFRPATYMAEWPDDAAAKSLSELPAYERRARNLIYKSCVEMSEDLRQGRFDCGSATADKILSVTKKDETHAVVRYSRTLTLTPKLADVERACGAITRPHAESSVTLERDPDTKEWGLPPPTEAFH